MPIIDFQENLREMVEQARLLNARPIMLTTVVHMPVLDESDMRFDEIERIKRDVVLYNAALRLVAQEEGVLLGDVEAWIGNANREEMFVDPVHYSHS